MVELYPWLQGLWQEWQESLKAQRFSNASLLISQAGMGSDQLVEQFSRTVMCQNYSDEACGFCHSCQLMASGSHPDFHVIKPEKVGKTITVEQIRQCNRLAHESSQLTGVRLFVIEPAEAMNESAANALLKTLEEPSETCMFLLVTERPAALLPTITSRCQQWNISTPNSTEITDWLATQVKGTVPAFAVHLSGDAPLAALDFIEQKKVDQYQSLEQAFLTVVNKQGDTIKVAKTLASEPIEQLTWLWYLLSDVQKIHFGLNQPFFTPGSQELSQALDYRLAFSQTTALSHLIDNLRNHSGLNAELLILDWLFKFSEEPCL